MSQKLFVSAWVEAYLKGQGLIGVADKLDMPKTAVSVKASNMRKAGIQLPRMPRGRNQDDTAEQLNKYIAAHI